MILKNWNVVPEARNVLVLQPGGSMETRCALGCHPESISEIIEGRERRKREADTTTIKTFDQGPTSSGVPVLPHHSSTSWSLPSRTWDVAVPGLNETLVFGSYLAAMLAGKRGWTGRTGWSTEQEARIREVEEEVSAALQREW